MEGVCWHCGAVLPPAKRPSGRQRRYCDDSCRQAAGRDARRARQILAADDLDVEKLEQLDQLIETVFVARDEPIAAAVEVVAALRATAGRARRLAEVGPAQLRWRHAATAETLDELIARCWDVG